MKTRLIIGLMILALLLNGQVSDYERNLDSLNLKLILAEGIERADILYELAKFTAPWDSDLCKRYIDEEQKILEDIEDKRRWGNLYQNLGYYNYYKDEYILAIENLYKAIDFFEVVNDYGAIGDTYTKIIVILYNAGNYGKAVEILPEAVSMARLSNNKFNLATGLYGLGYFYNNIIGDYEESKRVHKEALELAISENIETAIVGGITTAYGYAYLLSGQPDSALILYKKALKTYNEDIPKDRAMLIQGLSETGLIFRNKNQIDSAIYYYKLALKKADEMTSVFGMAYINLYLGTTYARNENYNQAIFHYQESIKNALISDSIGHGYLDERYKQVPIYALDVVSKLMTPKMTRISIMRYLQGAYFQLSRIYEIEGEMSNALIFLKKSNKIKNELEEYQKSNELLGIQLEYETQKKDQQIILLSQQKELNEYQVKQSRIFLFGLIGLILLVIAVVFLLVRQNRLKATQKTIVLEQKLLRAQMNPHFIYRALSNISNLVEKENNTSASSYLIKFSRLVRHILESTRIDFIELDDEIMNLNNYLSLQQLRFNEKFDYTIQVDENIDTEELEIPPMLIQPFVENAIEHIIKPGEVKGSIDIQMRIKGSLLQCVIKDNAIGRNIEGQHQKEDKSSLAISIIRQRIQILNKKLKQKAFLEIEDMKDEKGNSAGTKVLIGIPINIS